MGTKLEKSEVTSGSAPSFFPPICLTDGFAVSLSDGH